VQQHLQRVIERAGTDDLAGIDEEYLPGVLNRVQAVRDDDLQFLNATSFEYRAALL